MSNIVLENVPVSLINKLWNKTSFANILWLYWDWMDWCQYNEVMPTNNDFKIIEEFKNNKNDSFVSWKDFLENLINSK